MSDVDILEVIQLGEVSKICRLCLENNDFMKPLVESPRLEYFREFSQLELSLNTKLPNNICRECLNRLDQLEQLLDFKLNCKHVQEILQVFYDHALGGECIVKVQSENEGRMKTEVIQGIIPSNEEWNPRKRNKIPNEVLVNKIGFAVTPENAEPIEDKSIVGEEDTVIPVIHEQLETNPCSQVTTNNIDIPTPNIKQEVEEVDSYKLRKICQNCKLPYININQHLDYFPKCSIDYKDKKPRKVHYSHFNTTSDKSKLLHNNNKTFETNKSATNNQRIEANHEDDDVDDVIPIPSPKGEKLVLRERSTSIETITDEYPNEKKTKIYQKRLCKYCSQPYKNYEQHKIECLADDSSDDDSKVEMCDGCGQIVDNLVAHQKNCQQSADATEYVTKIEESESSMSEDEEESPEGEMCERCGDLVESLASHRKTCLNTCVICNFVGSTRLDLRQHISKEHSKNHKICSSCKQEVPDLLVHRRESKACQFKCDQCTYTTADKKNLPYHLLRHSNEKKYACSFCGTKFKHRNNVIRHEQTHKFGRRFKCKLCPRKFTSKLQMEDHLNLHYNLKPYSCKHCDLKFVSSSHRSHHVAKFHPDKHNGKSSTPVKPQTPQKDKTKEDKPSDKPKLYECEQCDKKYKNQNMYYLHRRMHNSPPIPCPQCDYKTHDKEYLKKHMRRHTGEKPFQCHLCPRTFTLKSYLKMHLVVHENKKQFNCTMCQKSFNVKWSLQEHLRRHAGIKPTYPCPACPKIYCNNTYRKEHVLKEHKDLDVNRVRGRTYIQT